MIKYSIKRILSLIPVIFAISIVLFSLTKIMPGDPVSMMIPTSAKPEQIPQLREEITKQLGLDKSLPEQYVAWIGNVAQGELGFSSWKNDDVKNVIANPLKNTVILNFFVLIFSLTISITAGIRSAVKKNSFVDQFWQVFSLICMSVPTFFIGLCLVFVFALRLGWLPSNGMPVDGSGLGEWVRFLVLPVVTLTITSLASTVRYVRNAMLDALSQDYIRTARSKGLSEKVVVYSHAFRNALIPIVTVVIAQIGTLFGGSMITESVFVWDGMGSTLLTALNRRDFYLVIAMNMFYAVVYLISNFIADLTYALVDPRIKLD
ncbi:ABC transporter permease [Massilicoli timonensis]|uniref:ABC transporter permease n=1 Tax=Massilicoli timonensis TaxID=2015901 RepID=A0ABT1SKR7_9FIRM|nr:ABC transporter permease [Massilicoli timonensis]MCQ5121821.1 ABC transporter permease [Massilicoli timonensis]